MGIDGKPILVKGNRAWLSADGYRIVRWDAYAGLQWSVYSCYLNTQASNPGEMTLQGWVLGEEDASDWLNGRTPSVFAPQWHESTPPDPDLAPIVSPEDYAYWYATYESEE
jgi:hypothetical protein